MVTIAASPTLILSTCVAYNHGTGTCIVLTTLLITAKIVSVLLKEM